ncbi:MAG: type VII secretion target [Mycobacterium sp.]|jgi:hypothetical protein
MRFDRGIRPATTGIDVSATHLLADRFDAAADMIDGAAGEHLMRLEFDGSNAGSAHGARGAALHAALQRLAAQASRWSRACTEIAVALRAGADGYSDAELSAAARIS